MLHCLRGYFFKGIPIYIFFIFVTLVLRYQKEILLLYIIYTPMKPEYFQLQKQLYKIVFK